MSCVRNQTHYSRGSRPASLAVAATTALFATTGSADARLGESIDQFRAKTAQSFKFKGMNKKQDRSYYMFSMIANSKMQTEAPGFGAGMTMTVVDRKIVSQAIAMHLGDDFEKGKELAAMHAVDFVYESIGKPAPKTEATAKNEFDQFRAAIEQVLAGTAQHVSYPGYNERITMKRTDGGDLLIGVTPDFGGDSKSKGKNR